MKLSALAFFSYLVSASARLNNPEDVRGLFEEGGGCECFSDYDCHPTCVFEPYSDVGHCRGDHITTTTTRTTTTTTTTEGDCPCDEISNIPDKCEVEILVKDYLDPAVAGAHNLAAQWLRLAFHDAGTFHQGIPEGGANGCLMNHPPMRTMPENLFLDTAINTLEGLRDDWEADPRTCIDISSADIIQFAGFFAVVRQENLMGTSGVMNTDKMTKLVSDSWWGRPDETNCNTAWTDNLPRFSPAAGSPVPNRCLASGGEIKNKMMDRNGFTPSEATALIGAHTIGHIRNTFGGSAAHWVTNGNDAATSDGPVFDNAYHDFLINTIVQNDVATFASAPMASMAPFTIMFPNWFKSPLGDHLDSDIALAFPTQNPAVHPDFRPFSVAFAANTHDFMAAFYPALDKMSQLGVKVPLSHPGPCEDPCGPDFTVDRLIKVTRKLGNATAVAAKTTHWIQQQRTDELREFTTPLFTQDPSAPNHDPTPNPATTTHPRDDVMVHKEDEFGMP